MLSHSLVVYGSSVSIVAQCVLSLASLICPLEPQLDIRPILTIYDSDLSTIAHPSSPLFLLAGTTDPQVVKMLSPHVDLLVLGEGRVEIEEYPGPAGITHLLAETDFQQTRLIQHEMATREGWNDRFLNDIRMVLRMQYKIDDSSGLSAFLHNLFYRHTITFLSPFRHCLKVFHEEVLASPHRHFPSLADTQILILPRRFFFETQMNGEWRNMSTVIRNSKNIPFPREPMNCFIVSLCRHKWFVC